MGMCQSCDCAAVATAKLILQDGRLQEYSYPVRVSYLLQKDPTCFICNADEMDFGDVVTGLSDDYELQPGSLYFALPLARLRRRIQPEEMAALAVKASAALMKSGISDHKYVSPSHKTGSPADAKKAAAAPNRRAGRRTRSGSREISSAMLTAIPE